MPSVCCVCHEYVAWSIRGTCGIDVSECLVVYESYESACLLELPIRVSSSLRELLVSVCASYESACLLELMVYESYESA